MRAVVTESPGAADVMQLRDVADPVAIDSQVVIDVAYCGCNWADVRIRAGIYSRPMNYPMTLGFEVSGVIASIGSGVTGFSIGDRVCAIETMAGGYAERMVVEEKNLVRLPDEIPLDVAAAFPLQGLTAYHLLHTVGKVGPGDTVLFHAIGGGVGLYVAQLGRIANARVMGTVGTPGKEALALHYGAERVVNHHETDFVEAALDFTGGLGLDFAIDPLGANTLDRTFDAMRTLGHVVSIGETEGLPFNNLRERLMPKSLTFTRFNLGHISASSPLGAAGYQALLKLIGDGTVMVPIVASFPLERATEMHDAIEGRGVSGKLLLAVRPDLR